MYFKIKDTVLFRNYKKYGYITDNSMFGYRTLDEMSIISGEKFVSESGAIMLSLLTKIPQQIDSIVKKLSTIFSGIGYEELKQDTIDFFDLLVEMGFLNRGETFDECNSFCIKRNKKVKDCIFSTSADDCSNNIFSQNDFLRSLHIEIASECNERCVHCYIPHEYKIKKINPDLFYKAVTEGRKMNIINVTLSGGEPLLHEEFISFLSKCRELDLSVNVLTNLTLLTEEIVDEMKKNPLLSVQTSIYSMDPLIHDAITNIPGSFKKTKSNMLKLKQAGIPLQISCPVMKQNKDTFYNVVCFGKKHSIPVKVDYVIFASYDHSNCNLNNRLSLADVEKAFDQQISYEYIHSLYDLAKEKSALTEQDPICSICRYYICISADGYVFPCVGWQSKIIGDLNSQTLKSIWEFSEEIKELRAIKRQAFPKCIKCKDRGYCNVCMMSNANESSIGDAFSINDYHCSIANIIHKKVDTYLNG